MMTLSTAQQQTDGAMLAIYEKLLRDQAKQTTLAQLRKDAVRCGQTLAQKGRDLQRIGTEFPAIGDMDRLENDQRCSQLLRDFDGAESCGRMSILSLQSAESATM